MGGLVFALFSACCTILAVICVTVFGASAQFVVNMYFIYLMLTTVALVAAPVCIFLFNFRRKWAGDPVFRPLDRPLWPAIEYRVPSHPLHLNMR